MTHEVQGVNESSCRPRGSQKASARVMDLDLKTFAKAFKGQVRCQSEAELSAWPKFC